MSEVPLSRNPLFDHLDRQGPLLTAEQERVLACAIGRGCQRSREVLAERNLRLVVDLAKRTAPRDGHELLDRIHAGSVGLIRAVDRFDPDRGRFTTYATWTIRQAIDRHRHTSSIPTGVPHELARDIQANKRIWWQQHGCEPADADLATEIGIDEDIVTRARAGLRRPNSIDTPVNEDSDTTLASIVTDDNAEDPSELVERRERRAELLERLDWLDARSRRVVLLRYGLSNGRPQPLTCIAQQMHLSLDDARRILDRAMRTLQADAAPPATPPRPEQLAWPDRCRQTARRGHNILAAESHTPLNAAQAVSA